MITFRCACGLEGCTVKLHMDLVPEDCNGNQVRGIMVGGGTDIPVSILVPEWLAQVIETAIIEHQGEK